jgi:hypothetical protein
MYDAALGEIEYLLALESNFTIYDFSRYPVWKPLWKLPKFQKLMKRYALSERSS